VPASSSGSGTAHLQAALAGAAGGFIGYLAGELMPRGDGYTSQMQMVIGSAIWTALCGIAIGVAILVYDNWRSLRGKWDRDLWRALPLFFGLSFLGGAAGQSFYFLAQNSLTRGIGWSLMGVGVGVGIGLLRRDKLQAQRGALGGAIGGFIGGFIFNALAMIYAAGDGSFSRAVGLMLTGAVIALLMRVVQDALKSAWLLGISTGPYEGREYPLNTASISVGRSEASDIALFREESLPEQVGAFVWVNEAWHWHGTPVSINGAFQAQALLTPGDTIQLGSTQFRFQTRSMQAPAQASAAKAVPQPQIPSQRYIPTAPTAVSQPSATPPIPVAPVPVAPAEALTVNMTSPWVLQGATPVKLPAAPAKANVGRATTNEIVLPEPSVSSRHARLEIERETLIIVDLGSTNGTFVNSIRATPEVPIALRAGDKLRLGRQEFVVQRG